MRSNRRHRTQMSVYQSLLPLNDVIIVLMLYFMTVSWNASQPPHEPPPSPGPTQAAVLTIELTENGQVRHQGREFDVGAFGEELKKTTISGLVVIVHDGGAPHQLQRLQDLRKLAMNANTRFSWNLASE
jgi:biopolymer transport protein ExbD